MKYIKYILFLLILTGCYGPKKAQLQVDKADSHYPEIVAKLARDKYPCTDLLKPDTAVIWKDSTIYIDCPEVTTTYETVRYDTVNNLVTKIVRVPVTLPVQTRTITQWYEDSAKIKLYDVALNKATESNTKLQASNDTLQAKAARRGKENWIWRIIAIGLAVWTVFRFWNKLTTIKMKSV